MARRWVHGIGGVVQNAHGFLVERLGYSLRLKADHDAEAWIHYPITAAEGESVLGVYIRFQTWSGAEATADSRPVHESHPSTIAPTGQPVATPVAAVAQQTGGAISAIYVRDGPTLVSSGDHLFLTALITGSTTLGRGGPAYEETQWPVQPAHVVSGPISVSVLVSARHWLDAVAIMGVAMEFADLSDAGTV
jgi:hypothetical protein